MTDLSHHYATAELDPENVEPFAGPYEPGGGEVDSPDEVEGTVEVEPGGIHSMLAEILERLGGKLRVQTMGGGEWEGYTFNVGTADPTNASIGDHPRRLVVILVHNGSADGNSANNAAVRVGAGAGRITGQSGGARLLSGASIALGMTKAVWLAAEAGTQSISAYVIYERTE